MNLTVQSDYAFRTLMFLAVRGQQNSTIQEISEHYGISRGHLMVLVHRLGNLGFLKNTRGRGGGVRLARPSSEIRLDEIVRATEPDFRMVECFEPDSDRCLITSFCRLRGVFGEALDAWLGVLTKYSLADLVGRNPALIHLLKNPRPIETGAARRRSTRDRAKAGSGIKRRFASKAT
jgi:Rrf2 family transcriptional regulator, nitric oxide-sensitive transcriptional repressor